MVDEGQPLDVPWPVDAVVAHGARRLRRQFLALTVPDRLDLRLRDALQARTELRPARPAVQ